MKSKFVAVAAAGATAAAFGAVFAGPSIGAGTTTVAVKDVKFVPKTLTIKKGTTVKFVWRGVAPHNVVVTKGPQKFRASTRKKGSYRFTFKKAGIYRILCTIHAPDMKMRITVK